ncbi:unnamed protein product, partial [Trichogramma brassicae]
MKLMIRGTGKEIVRYVNVNVYATSCARFVTNKDRHIFGKLPLVKRQKYSLLEGSSITFLSEDNISEDKIKYLLQSIIYNYSKAASFRSNRVKNTVYTEEPYYRRIYLNIMTSSMEIIFYHIFFTLCTHFVEFIIAPPSRTVQPARIFYTLK